MKTYTYSEARQHFAALLDEARSTGRVQIRRRDGQLFMLQPATQERSPLDVPGVDAGLLAGDSAAWLREEREAAGDRLLKSASGAPANAPRWPCGLPRSGLRPEDVKAAIAYAADLARERLLPLRESAWSTSSWTKACPHRPSPSFETQVTTFAWRSKRAWVAREVAGSVWILDPHRIGAWRHDAWLPPASFFTRVVDRSPRDSASGGPSALHQSVVSRIEQGVANPTAHTLAALARTLDARLTLSGRHVWGGSSPGLLYGGCHGDDQLDVFAELRRIVDEVIALFSKDGKALPPPTSGRDFANKMQNVA